MSQDQPLKFALGRTVITSNAQGALHAEDVKSCMDRHQRGDWGDLCAEDHQSNEDALRQGGRLFSAYVDRDGIKFWIITEADRSATTVLLPEDY
jgi:hypothetical protein